MATLTIRNLEETVKENLRRQAAAHGCSMEEEARRILQEALSQGRQEDKGFGSRIHARFNVVAHRRRIGRPITVEDAKEMISLLWRFFWSQEFKPKVGPNFDAFFLGQLLELCGGNFTGDHDGIGGHIRTY